MNRRDTAGRGLAATLRSPRAIATSVSLGRLVIGTGLLVAPGAVARGWIGEDVDTRGARVFARAVGGRDLALAVGTLAALREGRARRWVGLSILADAADFAGTVAIRPAGTRSGVATLAVAAAGAVVAQAWAASRLE